MKPITTFLALACLVLVGCADEAAVAPEIAAPAVEAQVQHLSPSMVKAEHASDIVSRSEVNRAAQRVVVAALGQEPDRWAANLQEADAQLDLHRETVEDEYLYLIDQSMSGHLLYVMDQACPDACNDLRAKHVERLLDAGYPDAARLETQLARLDLPADVRRAAEQQAAANAHAWLGTSRTLAKNGCSGLENEDCTAVSSAQDEATRRIAEAAQRLQ